MKKNNLLFIFVIGLLFTGCSDVDDSIMNDEISVKNDYASLHIDSQEALGIANKVLYGDKSTRNTSSNTPTFNYVINDNKTRSLNIPDTLAYVINYPDNGGFVIVSTDRRVYPVLAFSNEGQFSFENESAKSNFIENIGTYIGKADITSSYTVEDGDFDGCYSVNPIVQTSLNQRSPWDKYVIQEHPGCPVGCVAVATALVMSNSKTELQYHGSTFYFNSIIDAIYKKQGKPTDSNQERIVSTSNTNQPSYTYEQAVDSMAKLLYWIGKDVNMKYKVNGSLAQSSNAYNLCKKLDYNIPSGYANFDINEISWYLKDNHIIYLRGADINGMGGHAWVSDGCYFCVNQSDRSKIIETYIHCDWGWGGSSNGYYSGAVFETSEYSFKPLNYFALKRPGININFSSK